jgi:hypothetical protein
MLNFQEMNICGVDVANLEKYSDSEFKKLFKLMFQDRENLKQLLLLINEPVTDPETTLVALI